MSQEPEKTDFADLWKISTDSTKIHPFFKWNDENVVELIFTDRVQKYKVQEFNGQYGKAPYILVNISKDEKIWFNISSIRLRKAILDCQYTKKEFPYKMQIRRIPGATSFDTEFVAVIIDEEKKD